MSTAARVTVRAVGVLALGGAGFLGGSIARAQWFDAPSSPAPAAAFAIDHTADLTAGPPNAPVTVRIFGDYECPACRMLQRALGDTLLSLARTGAIRLLYLHRPLTSRKHADVAAAVIACAPDPWSHHRLLYQNDTHVTDPPRESLGARATRLAVSAGHAACARSDSTLARARAAIAAARAAGFHEVPAVVVNESHVHFRTLPALLRHIERAIASAQSPDDPRVARPGSTPPGTMAPTSPRP